jgi:hypothetical protein
MALETEPFEEAGLRGSPRDEGRDDFPALAVVMNISYGNSVSLTVFADQPNQYL